MTESAAGGPHVTRPVHWVSTAAIVVGFAMCGLGIILASVVIGVIGGVLLVGGAIAAWVSGLMESVEQYPSGREDTT